VAARTAIAQRTRRVHVEPDPENPFSGRDAWFLARLSRVRGEPVLLEELTLDLEVFPGLDRHSLVGRSLSQLIEEVYHLRPEAAEQDFRVLRADARRARLLACPEREPLLLVKRRLHFPDARNVIFAELWCRTDQLVFSQTLSSRSLGEFPHA